MKKERLQHTIKTEIQAEDILGKLTLAEKVSLLSGEKSLDEVNASIHGDASKHYNEEPYAAGGIAEYGIPKLLFVDGTRGVVCGYGIYTCFPVTSMRGATFNKSLEEEIGKAMADEVIAAGGNFFGGVCVNIPYHPGWGRAQETYGEDPCLIGELASASIRGIKSRGVIACIKHFAFNSMENMRFNVDITCDLQTEREIFLPQFKKCIDSGADAVMSAYNSYKGTCCGHNSYLLNHVLRQEWGFDGIVISDFNWGISDTVSAFLAGVDIEMPNTNYYGDRLISAVENGELSEEDIDAAALRVIKTLTAYTTKAAKVKFDDHAALALQCAREGITLLRNQNNLLPLRGKRAYGSIAILGKLADTENIGDYGSSRVYPPYVTTVLDGIRNLGKQSSLIYYSGDSASHCKRLASEADTVIIVVGNTYVEEGECLSAYTPVNATDEQSKDSFVRVGGDRVSGLGLSENDLQIIHSVSEIRKDAIVIVYGGSTILMSEWCDLVGAILLAYYPGMEGGTVIAETLFGKNNPSGRLPFVIPRDEKDLPNIDWNATHQEYGYYHGYTLLDIQGKEPLYPFGFGLSYTTFQIQNLKTWMQTVENIDSLTEKLLCAEVEITNTGKRTGSEVVFMYIGKKDSIYRRPVRILRAFEKVKLKKNQSQMITLKCSLSDLRYFDEIKKEFQLETGKYEIYIVIGNKPQEELVGEVNITDGVR